MVLDVNYDADVVRSVKRKFGKFDGGPENPSVGFSKGELKKKKTNHIKDADSDYLQYLRGSYMSIRDDAQDELFVQDVGDDPLPEFSTEDVGGDPQYELFLSSLKKHGSSYVLQVDEKIGLIKPLKYEECESDDARQEDLDSLSKTQWRESEIDDDYAFFHEHLRVEGSNLIYQLVDGLRMVYEDLPNCQTDNGAYSRKQKSKLSIRKEKSSDSSEEDGSSHSGSPRRKKGVVYDCQDLPNVQTDNGTSSGKPKSKLSIHSENSSDSSEEDDSSHSGSPRIEKCNKFRVRIMRVLRKPYDKEEHKKLMEEITLRKNQLRHRDLRSGEVRFCVSDKEGKSYLDHYGNLKRRVEAAAKDDCKQLNLLRGFFFWLQNLAQDGSFIPWTDKECLAVLPQAC